MNKCIGKECALKRVLVIVMVLVMGVWASSAWAVHRPEPGEEESILDWGERIHLNGTLEVDYGWTEHEDVGDDSSDNASQFSISAVEFGVGVEFTNSITGDILFLKEDIGTDDESDLEVDEATITFESERLPLHVVVGKRPQPFGVFESHLLTDPMTQDAYETNVVGVTAGYEGPMDLSLTATLYKGDEMMDHLFESGLFDSGTIARQGDGGNDVSSYILSASVVPVPEMLTLFAGYLSERGRGERNSTLNVGANLVLNGIEVDAEYMLALSREEYQGSTQEFTESALSLGLAYELVVREREVLGGALFAKRKAHIVTEPLEIGVRYEYFDDDGLADAFGTWSVEQRVSAGGRYSFYYDVESGLAAYVGAEYRYTDYDDSAVSAGDNSEFIARLGVTF
jgi:hypothetical protein